MEEIKDSTEEAKEATIKKAIVQSEHQAPVETLENCIALVQKLYDAKADSSITAEEAWAILGPRGTMSPKISACIQYGLLENNPTGKGYKVSDFGISVIHPEYTDPTYIKKKQLEAFNSPEFYKILIERYNSKGLPNQKGLINILVTEYKFNKSYTAPKAASVFLENCEFLNLNDSGRMRFFMPNVTIPEGNGSVRIPHGAESAPPPPPSNSFRLPIDLGDKTAYLEYPKDITLDEIEELEIMVSASINSLKLRKKRDKSNIKVQDSINTAHSNE